MRKFGLREQRLSGWCMVTEIQSFFTLKLFKEKRKNTIRHIIDPQEVVWRIISTESIISFLIIFMSSNPNNMHNIISVVKDKVTPYI